VPRPGLRLSHLETPLFFCSFCPWFLGRFSRLVFVFQPPPINSFDTYCDFHTLYLFSSPKRRFSGCFILLRAMFFYHEYFFFFSLSALCLLSIWLTSVIWARMRIMVLCCPVGVSTSLLNFISAFFFSSVFLHSLSFCDNVFAFSPQNVFRQPRHCCFHYLLLSYYMSRRRGSFLLVFSPNDASPWQRVCG